MGSVGSIFEKTSEIGRKTAIAMIVVTVLIGIIFLSLGVIYSILWNDKLNDKKPSIQISCNNHFLITEILAIVFIILALIFFGTAITIYSKYKKLKRKAEEFIKENQGSINSAIKKGNKYLKQSDITSPSDTRGSSPEAQGSSPEAQGSSPEAQGSSKTVDTPDLEITGKQYLGNPGEIQVIVSPPKNNEVQPLKTQAQQKQN
jgi:preprotein translocase subunit SecG